MPVAYEALQSNICGGILRCRVRAKHAKAFEEYATASAQILRNPVILYPFFALLGLWFFAPAKYLQFAIAHVSDAPNTYINIIYTAN